MLKIIIYLGIILFGLVFGTLIKNNANLLQPPGLKQRLATFLDTNIAETSPDTPFRELRTPQFKLSVKALYNRVIQAGIDLGWDVADFNANSDTISFVVESAVFSFRDDVLVRVKAIDAKYSTLYIQSKSRVGNADFAANSAHIQALIKTLRNESTN